MRNDRFRDIEFSYRMLCNACYQTLQRKKLVDAADILSASMNGTREMQ